MKPSQISLIVFAAILTSCASIQINTGGWEKTSSKVLDSVVLIETEVAYEDMFGRPRVGKSIGSGAMISKDGWIITNAHVLMDEDSAPQGLITIKFQDSRTFAAEKFYLFPQYDLALLKINVNNEPFLKVRLKRPVVGEPCLAIGNPVPYQFVVKEGIVSQYPFTPYNSSLQAEGAPWDFSLIASSASIMPGNSGGPLVDKNGNIIGINESYYPQKPVYGLAISNKTLLVVLNKVSFIEQHLIYTLI
jgi:S1-C subfamily serine protease